MALNQSQYDQIVAMQAAAFNARRMAGDMYLLITDIMQHVNPGVPTMPQDFTFNQLLAHVKTNYNAKRQALIDAANAITVIP